MINMNTSKINIILKPGSVKILTAYHLKMIALVTMIIDHIGIVFFPEILMLRIIGRTAFILYAFMIVEGFIHTSSFHKYIKRMMIFCFLSEIPFDLAIHGKLIYLGHQNIFFTLILGIIGLKLLSKNQSIFKRILISLSCMFIAYILKFDYSWYGILVIFIFYYFRTNTVNKYLLTSIAGLFASAEVFVLQFLSPIAFIPISMYNHQQGTKTGIIYYSFYALHLLMFWFIKTYRIIL